MVIQLNSKWMANSFNEWLIVGQVQYLTISNYGFGGNHFWCHIQKPIASTTAMKKCHKGGKCLWHFHQLLHNLCVDPGIHHTQDHISIRDAWILPADFACWCPYTTAIVKVASEIESFDFTVWKWNIQAVDCRPWFAIAIRESVSVSFTYIFCICFFLSIILTKFNLEDLDKKHVCGHFGTWCNRSCGWDQWGINAWNMCPSEK